MTTQIIPLFPGLLFKYYFLMSGKREATFRLVRKIINYKFCFWVYSTQSAWSSFDIKS